LLQAESQFSIVGIQVVFYFLLYIYYVYNLYNVGNNGADRFQFLLHP
jgi:hypothetical protein